MDWLVRWVSRATDKPLPKRPGVELFPGDPGIGSLASSMLVYKTDPGEAAYWYARHKAIEWKKEHLGSEAPSIMPTERSNALYYYRRASMWGDDEAAAAWIKQYVKLGGTADGLLKSIRMAHPLAILTDEQEAAFLGSLSDVDRREILDGIAWYGQVYGEGLR